MRMRVILFACALVLPAAASFAAEKYMCKLTEEGAGGIYKQDASQYVSLSIDKDGVRPIVHIAGASKDLTFSTCKDVAADGSNFSRWFKTECRDLKAVDTWAISFEPYLIGAYAGISPVIDKDYSMYDPIEALSKKSGIELPARTFAIYANRKPVHEFFCYAVKPKP